MQTNGGSTGVEFTRAYQLYPARAKEPLAVGLLAPLNVCSINWLMADVRTVISAGRERAVASEWCVPSPTPRDGGEPRARQPKACDLLGAQLLHRHQSPSQDGYQQLQEGN